MRDFQYHAPTSLKDVYALLGEHGEDSRLISGGTGLINMMKQDLIAVDHLVSVQNVPDMEHIRMDGSTLHLGGQVKQQEVATSDIVEANFPLLTETYKEVATVRVRNAATVGGGVAHGDPAQDPPTSLLVLDAQVHIGSAKGDRTQSIRDGWFIDYYETNVAPGEVVIGVSVPEVPANSKYIYTKFLPRTADDYATVSISALGVQDGDTITDVRLALGAVNTTAVLSQGIPSTLNGKKPTDALLREAAETVRAEVSPTPDFRGSAEYKTDMAVVFARRALEAIFGMS
jgi:carbon-monoxide dehydrogenase medium subunit